ncbi:MAG: YdcF family protein [Ruminococcus sp.]|nr:YdcF family protein [Ruminococcus sp.]
MSFLLERMGMRVVPTLISFILLLLFLAPFSAGIVNLGNCVGVAVSAVCTGIFAFFKPFSRFISHLMGNPIGKAAVIIASAIISICVALAIVISCFMVRAAHDEPDGADTTMIVLGCKVKNGNPSLMLRRRLDAAYDYLSEHEEVTVIVSGGQGTDELISEAQCMNDYLVSRGIAPERIIMEDQSSSTYENLKYSKKIIDENGLSSKITIVTDGYHQLRAEMIASDLGIESYNISAETSWWLLPTYWVREWFGVAYQFVFG